MKIFYILMIASVLILYQFSILSAETAESTGNHEKIQELAQSMDEMARHEAGLRDQLTSRIMRIEEDLETMRQTLTENMSEMERTHSQELTLIREYHEILNSEIDAIKKTTSLNQEQVNKLSSNLNKLEQELDTFNSFQNNFPQEIQTQLENSLNEIDKKISEISSWIQNQDSKINSLESIEGRISETSSDFSRLENITTQLSQKIEEIQEDQEKIIEQTQEGLKEKVKKLSLEIDSWDDGIMQCLNISQEKIQKLEEKIRQREQNIGIAILATGFLALAGVVFSMLSLVKARKFRKINFQTMEELKNKISEQGAVLDTKLVELLEKQIPLIPDPQKSPDSSQDDGQSIDHTLALIMGEEIFRIMKRKNELSKDSQAFEHLKVSLRRMWTAFKEKGYELIDLENKPYHEDMEIQAELFLTHELLPGEQIISRVIRPQIKYKGKIIQKGEVEVLVGE
ncbi:MAG: hypothetical protein ABR542_02470 [Desulfonatronovibrio sp.]